MKPAYSYFLVHKPFGMLSQFSSEAGALCLKDLNFSFPSDVYPVGRLDKDSEGLLLITNDKQLTHRLLTPEFGHEREYHVQVEGLPDENALKPFFEGIRISGEQTRPARATVLKPRPVYPPRNPPVRVRKTVPDTWISVVLTEGKNRQVRKMTAACGFPTLRLIRIRIESLFLGSLLPGEVRVPGKNELSDLLSSLKK